MQRRSKVLPTVLLGSVAVVGVTVLACAGIFGPCWRAWAFSGVLLDECPAGDVLPAVAANVSNVGRKDEGYIEVSVAGWYVDRWNNVSSTPVRRFAPRLLAIDPLGAEHAVEPKDVRWGDDWEDGYNYTQNAIITLPDGPDGDWILRVTADSAAGVSTTDLALPLYAPARVHVLTDAPLYKPGQTIRFRAVVLSDKDLTPLEDRPGTWVVTNSYGETLLEEKTKTGPFGVASGTVPIDALAESGDWTVTFRTGANTDARTVPVHPFQLPRFTVETKADKPWYTYGDVATIDATVRYTSGAPVRNAPVDVAFYDQGVAADDGAPAWPVPAAWLEPQNLMTDAQGKVSIKLPAVPGDLVGKGRLAVQLSARDETGDVAVGSASLLYTQDRIAVSSVTELADGVVPSANNRVFVRATTPDGQPLRDTTLKLTRTGDRTDKGIVETTDADGVARFQLDPGEPVTVVVPPLPWRPPTLRTVPTLTVTNVSDALSGESPDLTTRAMLDRWAGRATACGSLIAGSDATSVTVTALVDGGGRVVKTSAGMEDPLVNACVASSLGGSAPGDGHDRLWEFTVSLSGPETPWLSPSTQAVSGDDASSDIDTLADGVLRRSRACVAGLDDNVTDLGTAWVWFTHAGSRSVDLRAVRLDSDQGTAPAAVRACVARGIGNWSLDEPADADGSGILTVDINIPTPPGSEKPQPMTWPGYAFQVAAFTGDANSKTLGETVLRLHPGNLPDLRLRFSDILVKPGDTLELLALRGPNFTGEFPKEMVLSSGDRGIQTFDFDPKKRKGTVTIPADARGFVHVSWNGVMAVAYVEDDSKLTLALSTDKAQYRPGDLANLTVVSTAGTKPVQAGVTLSGVDQTLGVLAALDQPDSLARLAVTAETALPAFGDLDARALQTGQIAGDNAAAATILRVSSLPHAAPGSTRVSATSQARIDADSGVADAFYTFYPSVKDAVRDWEKSVKEGDVMTPKILVRIWEATLKAHPVVDPFGRPLHLRVLPQDLLAFTDPRVLVSNAALLPEDIENWPAYVASESP